jgi:hypothetical protein
VPFQAPSIPVCLIDSGTEFAGHSSLAELENPLRQYGVQLGHVADRKVLVDELKRASLVMRAQSYRRRLFSEFDRAREVFLP